MDTMPPFSFEPWKNYTRIKIMRGKAGGGVCGAWKSIATRLRVAQPTLDFFFFFLKTYFGKELFYEWIKPDTRNAWDLSECLIWVSCDIWLL